MHKNIFLNIIFITIFVFASGSAKAQYPTTLDTSDSGVLKQCATICLRLSQLQECKTKTSFHYSDSHRVDGLVVSLFDFKSGATLDLNEEKRRALVTVFDEITANIQTDSLVQYVKVDATQFGKTQEYAIIKSDFLKMQCKKKVAEKYLNNFMALDYMSCYQMLDPSIQRIFADTLFYKSCNDIVIPRGTFKSYEFIYFDEKVDDNSNEQFWIFIFAQTYAFDKTVGKYTIRKKEGDDTVFGFEVR